MDVCGGRVALALQRYWKRNVGHAVRRFVIPNAVDFDAIERAPAALPALVSISRFEGHPNTVIEALACGCPIVASDIPAHRMFLDEESAILVPAADVDAVAGAIRCVIAAPESARRRAVNARRRAEQYSVQHAVAAYEEVYDAVLGMNGRAA